MAVAGLPVGDSFPVGRVGGKVAAWGRGSTAHLREGGAARWALGRRVAAALLTVGGAGKGSGRGRRKGGSRGGPQKWRQEKLWPACGLVAAGGGVSVGVGARFCGRVAVGGSGVAGGQGGQSWRGGEGGLATRLAALQPPPPPARATDLARRTIGRWSMLYNVEECALQICTKIEYLCYGYQRPTERLNLRIARQ